MDTGVHISLTRVLLADGAFDSDARYVRTVADPVNRLMNGARGSTIDIIRYFSGVNTNCSWAWRASSANVVRPFNGDPVTYPPPVNFNTGLDIAL